MGGHGATGRKFAGRVLQLITSSTGLDDWEWGVTLFARDLKSIRDVVYEMRFDPGSAVYGLFGEFYVGLRFAPGRARREALHALSGASPQGYAGTAQSASRLRSVTPWPSVVNHCAKYRADAERE